MKTKVITLEVLEDNQNTIGYVTLTNSKGDTFEILDSYRNEELIDFIKRAEQNIMPDDRKAKSVGKKNI